jgi:hypothetical protein
MSLGDRLNSPIKGIIYSWPVIIIVFIIFFPIGIYLIYKRFSLDKTETLKNSKKVAVYSILLIGIAIIYLIEGLTGGITTTDGKSATGPVIFATLLFGGSGVYLYFVSKRMKKEGEKYMQHPEQQYPEQIINQNQTSLDSISTAVNIHVGNQDFQIVIDSGSVQQQQAIITPAQPQARTVVCSGCGSHSTIIVGQTSECEYCGSLLQ